eukprot:10712593-Lingulodinium_polyedra.AAC.1
MCKRIARATLEHELWEAVVEYMDRLLYTAAAYGGEEDTGHPEIEEEPAGDGAIEDLTAQDKKEWRTRVW